MNLNDNEMEPIERWLQKKASITSKFPSNRNDYFKRYWGIKSYLAEHVYPYIAAGTSAEDQGIYTDHSIDHFNTVIRYAGHLLGLKCESDQPLEQQEINLTPYEVFILLVSILLHDAGNIKGRQGHEKRPFKILMALGAGLSPDKFEASPIATIAEAHGGKVENPDGSKSKDTIEGLRLKEFDSYGGIQFRPKAIAALVRFADEICEDHTRAARFLIKEGGLPKKSEVFHEYANSIKSVVVDLRDKSVHIDFKLEKHHICSKFGKDDGGGGFTEQYLIDEINERLEKMFCELMYCQKYMYDLLRISRIKASVEIYEECNDHMVLYKSKRFELSDIGYPQTPFSIKTSHPEWTGSELDKELKENL